jgi:hypothetical protein
MITWIFQVLALYYLSDTMQSINKLFTQLLQVKVASGVRKPGIGNTIQ